LEKKYIEFLVKTRAGYKMIEEAYTAFIDSIEITAGESVNETEIFFPLKFEEYQGQKIGCYQIAFKANNDDDGAWTKAYNVLAEAKSNIEKKYHGKTFQFGYWLWDAGKIYRQRLTVRSGTKN
jgi:hypothetical protein